MNLAILGLVMIAVFMALILTRRMTALTALMLIPPAFGLIGGFGLRTFDFASAGIKGVAPTFSVLVFAILYFSIMLHAGLFDPVVRLILRIVKGDPFKVVLGTAILATVLSLDGDGTTTIMICCTALVPVYDRLKINKVYLALFIIMPNGIVNLLPWGGPTARVMAVLSVDSVELLRPLIPIILVGLAFTTAAAAFVGIRERRRLGVTEANFGRSPGEGLSEGEELKRPKLIWVNLALTVATMAALMTKVAPAAVAFGLGSCVALLVNYPKRSDEGKVIGASAPGIFGVVLMILGAGVIMGVFSESGMAKSLSEALVAVIPASWSKYFLLIVALISAPGTFLLNNDAFYLGVLPVLAKTAESYGFTSLQVGFASLLGQPMRLFSPLIPALYLLVKLVDVDFGEYQRKAIPWSMGLLAATIAAGIAFGGLVSS